MADKTAQPAVEVAVPTTPADGATAAPDAPAPAAQVFTNTSLFCLNPKHPLRATCIQIVGHRHFDNIIMALILLNCVFLCLFDPLDKDENSSLNKMLEFASLLFGICFLIEMILKIIAMGFYTPKELGPNGRPQS